MRSDPSMPRPTEAELAILNVLWARGEATVREVFDALYREAGGYTSALKLLQVMHAKGLVLRDEHQRAHVYRPAISRDSTQRRMLTDLTRRLFGGRPAALVLSALGSDDGVPSADELAAIRALLDEMERGRHGSR
jgi:BlaI family transcriptional regulator, penicillinase repressor